MRTLKITVAYDGTRLVGWQRQAEGDSVQGLLEQALSRIEGAPVTVHGAGRTDAGVHALGQVASARVAGAHDEATLRRALNAQLPPDVRVLAVSEAPPDFHARFAARSKTYRYMIRTGTVASPFDRAYVWHVPEPLDTDAMREAAGRLLGTHDFSAFQSAGGGTSNAVRTVMRSELARAERVEWLGVGACDDGEPLDGSLVAYEIEGTGFLRHMVRAIVGTLVEVGRRRWRPDVVMTLLHGATRAQAGATAPPHGLFLVRVDYH